MGGYAWVTLATNDSYSLGALVLAHSLKKSKTAHKSVVLITPAVSQPMREQLQTVFDVIKVVDVLDSKDEAHLALMQRPELGITFTKIHCWKLVEFDKCVFLDADTLVVRNCDELFEREEFSAAPDVSWPDCFNSGVFVFKPSIQTFNELLQFAVEKGSFDGGDQGLLNQFFSGWATEDIKKHLPFVYNLTSVAAYSYIPAFKYYGSETRIVHFIGTGKPWLQQLDPATRTITPTSGSEHLAPLLQQWWDLFCEKVHPGLDKNLESSNDGMSHPPVAACSNSLPIALTDDSQTPRLIEPCTPYREKDDFRQYNLPYQPFDVKGTSGELLNVKFLLASAGDVTQPEVCSDEQQRRERDETEEKKKQEERREKEEESDSNVPENEHRRETKSAEVVTQTNCDFRIGERGSEEAGVEEQKQEQEEQEQPKEAEQPPPPVHPFDYDSFFPDETCINKYLEQNVMTYQPYDNHQRHHPHHHQQENHQHENHPPENDENSSQNLHCENINENNLNVNDSQPPEDPVPTLPRFLTIPENDKRQSGNAEAQAKPKSDLPREDPPTRAPDQPCAQEETEEKRKLTKSKSMPYLRYDVTEVPPAESVWKSQPNVNVDLNRKFSMPKLKPILPRQNSLSKSVPSVVPRVTLYTEFLMSSEYKDPANLPKDKVGFVETLIHKKGELRRSKSAADIEDKFGPLPYNFSPEIEQPATRKEIPSLHLDTELYDLSQCKRQMGNKPKAKCANQRKESRHSMPALKPLVPPKDKKSTLIKKRKSKELSPEDGGREKTFKRERRLPKERKRECKTTPRTGFGATTGKDVNEILTRLREFSKNYLHFFGVEPQARAAPINCRNAIVQADGTAGSECGASEGFFKTSSPGGSRISRGTQTAKEEQQQETAVNSKFRHCRNDVTEKPETSQEGLLKGIVSREKEVAEGVRASSEALQNCTELKRENERVGDPGGDGGVEKKRVPEVDGLLERDSPRKGITIDSQSTAKGVEKEEDSRNNCTLHKTPESENCVNGTVQSTSPSTRLEPKEIQRNGVHESPESSDLSSPEKSKTNGKISNRSEEDVSEPQSSLNGGMEAATSGPVRTKSCSEGPETNGDAELGSKESDVGEIERRSTPSRLDFGKNAARTESSLGDRITPNGSGRFEAQTKAAEPTSAGKQSNEETLSEPRSETSAETSSQKKIFGESKRSKTVEKFEAEAPKDGGPTEKLPEKFSPSSGKKERIKEKGRRGKLKNKKQVSRDAVPLPESNSVATEIMQELTEKAILQQSQAPASRCSTPQKTPKPAASPKNPSGPPPKHRNRPPNNSPDGTGPPVGENACAAAGRHSPPSSPDSRSGNALSESCEDRKVTSGIAGAIAQLSLEAGSDRSSESAAKASTAHQEYVRRQNWETGNMDYMGRDSFDNIWSKICQTLGGKESEEAGPAAVSPKQFTESLDPAISAPQSPPAAETPAPLSTAPQKCPENMKALPGDPAAGPVKDDEIIFSKPDDGQSVKVKEPGKESSVLGPEPTETGKVKLSDILIPSASAPGPQEMNQTDTAGDSRKRESAVPEPEASAQKATEKAEEGKTSAGEKPAEVEPKKAECQTVAVCQPIPPGAGTNISSVKDEKPGTCTTVAIPSPPIAFPGAPFSEKDKKAQSRRKAEETANEKFEPIPLPPPDTPTEAPGEDASAAKTPDSAKDQGKQKKGVFTKILEMVGVSPKERSENEISKSVFYDVEGSQAAKEELAKGESAAATEPEPQAPTASQEQAGKSANDEGESKTEKTRETEEKAAPVAESQKAEVSVSKSEEASKEKPPEAVPAEKKAENAGKTKPPIEKPARNVSPKEPKELSKTSIQVSPKSKSPSPKLTLSKESPEAPTPSPQPETAQNNSGLLKVDETIPETPPVPPEPPRQEPEESVRGKVLTEVEDIIGKAKSEVESRLQDREKETGEASDLINTMKMMVGGEQAQQPQAQQPQAPQPQSPEVPMEELRVTSEEERMRHKGEVVSSKLSDQILKAIPPPRRKAISESSASSSAIPKSAPAPDQKSVSGEAKPKAPKGSSIPVPPPRSRGKPTQPAPSRGKGKK